MSRSHRTMITLNLVLLFASSVLLAPPVSADVRLPHVIGSHMVLQADMPLPVWGWADPGESVTVSIGDNQATAKADADGKWMVKLPAMKVGGPCEMTVSGKNTIKLTDILVGEVWLCSGQSNMEMGVGVVKNGKDEIAAANYPNIRLFHVPFHRASGLPEPDIDSAWRPCSPQSIAVDGWGGFSAAAYFFGRELHKDLKVPIGLIDSSWGGTRIEPWTPPVGFASVPSLQQVAKDLTNADAKYNKDVAECLVKIEAWLPEAKKASAEGKRVPLPPAWPVHAFHNNPAPASLYNGMINALVPFAIRGTIWYQGCSNRGDGMTYFEKMKALINGWRTVWGEGDFPFYFVQLAPFRYQGDPIALPMIWEAQTAALSIPNTGMAVTVDTVDNIRDIHPIDKQDVGKRLALWALAKTYGHKDLVYSGPLYKSMSVEDGKVRIRFDHIGGGLATRDGKAPTFFQVAGEDKKFVDAQAKIDGDTLLVWSDAVAAPVAVRFAWHQEAQPNLMNKEGLPASPFRTDGNSDAPVP
jgi:sialate O-acetylesterase